MADAEQVVAVESRVDAETQAKAEKLGWIPPARFKGDPERFVDADAYIERGETVLPIIKEHNKRLQAELDTLRANQTKTESALATATKAIEEIEERHTVATQKAVANARTQLKAQLAQASQEGDHDGVADLIDRLTQLDTAEEKAPPIKQVQAEPEFKPDPGLVEWNAENPWFGKDKRRTALALGIAQELREAGEKSVGREFYDKVAAEVAATLDKPAEAPRGDKVEGARNGSDRDDRTSVKKGFAALPADAKAACDADSRNFVGPNKRYKTQAEWRNRYAEIYFEQGA